ncbi:MAG: MBL fold metallo-hydrolase [Pseudomonadota bacterium]
MNRRQFVAATAAGAASAATSIAAPFIQPAAAQARGLTGPTQATKGAIDISDRVKGYTVDSVRNHSINAYYVKGLEGTVAIDTLWRIPEAEDALGRFRALTGRSTENIDAVLITHMHSDHYGGLATYRAASGNAPAFATRTVHRVIENDEHGFYANRIKDFGTDIPKEIPVPDTGLFDGVTFESGGVTIEPTVLRSNEALETTLLYYPEDRVLFTADLVNNQTTPVFYQGEIDSWLTQLKGLRARFPEAETIAPGHGPAGDFDELIRDEIAYLETFRSLVENELERGGGAVTSEGVQRIKNRIVDAFPNWRTSAGVPSRDRLIELNINWTLRGWRIDGPDAASPAEFRDG